MGNFFNLDLAGQFAGEHFADGINVVAPGAFEAFSDGGFAGLFAFGSSLFATVLPRVLGEAQQVFGFF